MGNPEAYNIRPAISSDATTLAHIELQAQLARGVALTDTQYYCEALRIGRLVQLETTWSSVALLDGNELQPAGFIFGYPRAKDRLPKNHHLDTLMVMPTHWRKGVASRLVDLALFNAARQDAASVDLWTDINNLSARSLYEKKGFVLTGETRIHPWLPKEQLEYRLEIPT